MSSGIQLPEVFLYGPKLQRESMKSWVDGIAEDLRQKNHVKWKCIKMICVNLSLEKAMAIPLQYSCLENPMDEGAR